MEGGKEMKRYRFLTNTFIDFSRNLFKDNNLPTIFIQQEKERLKQELSLKYGQLDIENKVNRYLEFDSPNMCIIVEYLKMLHEISDSYVFGNYYPSLTGACSLGERIFNIIILRLRSYYKHHKLYKEVYSKKSFQDWDKAINVLSQWGIIDNDLERDYRRLAALRNESIHFGNINDIKKSSLDALRIVMTITDKLFGLTNDIYFWCPGEIYVKQIKESKPFVREFILPKCILLGYKSSIAESKDTHKISLRFQDQNDYEDRKITDEEYRQLRIEWRSSKDKGEQK